MTMITMKIPDFTVADAAFGASPKDYMDQKELDEVGFYNGNQNDYNCPFTNAVRMLFFEGGKLADYNLKFKEGVDKKKAMLAIQAFLCSWAPKHEIKVGTVAYALSQWCEVIDNGK